AVEVERPGIAIGPQLAQDADQVASHRAADAAVVHLDDLLLAALEQDVVVHARLTILVLDDGNALPVLLLEDAVQKRRLAAAEEAGEDRHRHHLFLFHGVWPASARA